MDVRRKGKFQDLQSRHEDVSHLLIHAIPLSRLEEYAVRPGERATASLP